MPRRNSNARARVECNGADASWIIRPAQAAECDVELIDVQAVEVVAQPPKWRTVATIHDLSALRRHCGDGLKKANGPLARGSRSKTNDVMRARRDRFNRTA